MNKEQLPALKAHIEANINQAVIDARTSGNHTRLAEIYNGIGTMTVWKTTLPVAEYRASLVWTEVDALTAGKARIWEWITGNLTLPINASDAAVRQGIADAFAGAGGTGTRTALTAAGKRIATKAEEIFATGTGTNGSPAVLDFEGSVTIQDIGLALR